ncbi:site-specific integrase [Eubacterium aggregans]|uniref:site-specific integrase n=1 Tax=Eubacterium aggregans TaxID=81409 RepID=UPI003F37EB8A
MEQRKLEKCLLKKECKDNAALGICLCLYTGIRIGELCALKWSAIDLTHGIIRIRETLQRIQQSNGGTRVIISTPKTHHSLRDIPIPKILIKELRQCTDLPQHYFLSGSVKPMEPRIMQLRFSRYVSEGGIEHANFYALRHTFATRCIESGVYIKSLSELLGHSSTSFTLNRYVHSSMDYKRLQMERLMEGFIR